MKRGRGLGDDPGRSIVLGRVDDGTTVFVQTKEAHHIEPTIPINDSCHNAHGKRKVYPIKSVCHFRLAITMAMIVAAADRDRSHPMVGSLRIVAHCVQASIAAVLAANRLE